MRSALSEACKSGLALFLALTLVVTLTPPPLEAQNTIKNGTNTGVPGAIVPGFLFEPEVPMASLKSTPTWNELEQLLDNPYRVVLCSSLAGNPAVPAQIANTPPAGNGEASPTAAPTGTDWPSYCTNPANFARRPGFGVVLPPLLVEPLNYNPTTGEEMRLVNSQFPAMTGFNNTSMCESATAAPCTPTPSTITVSSGASRFLNPDDIQIDYNTPIRRDAPTCITSTETPEGISICGGDPGEPVFGQPNGPGPAFGFRNLAAYSVPAIQLPAASRNPSAPIPASARLFDPQRGLIAPYVPGTGQGGLRKPSLRKADVGGTGNNANGPNYLINVDTNNVVPSSENDYIRNRTRAVQLGKALFWDMQIGSDGVQSCGSCHAHAGADNRTKNQLNPNHLGSQGFNAQLDLHGVGSTVNTDLTAADYPLHKLGDPNIAGDPACTTPLTGTINAGVLENNFPNGGSATVCDAGNILSDTDDVASSMGVHFGLFQDIPTPGVQIGLNPGSFGPPGPFGVRALIPDTRQASPIDPIADFAGTTGNQFRRVEPRNTPTIFAAAFNFDNFWDGRARHDDNGGSVFGAADPQAHVFVGTSASGTLIPTRQLIKFSSLASLAKGPALSEFEMSFQGRNWSKIGKKLLQGNGSAAHPNVTPLANQLVATDDSVLGEWSNQGGSSCAALPVGQRSGDGTTAPGKPGLCINYRTLVQQAFYPALWQNTGNHLVGCYTDGNSTAHPNQCSTVGVNVSIPVLDHTNVQASLGTSSVDPFDNYVLSVAAGTCNAACQANTNQFSHMEGNFSLFWGQSLNAWVNMLVPDNTGLDQFLDVNQDAFASLGESGEPALVPEQPNCTSAGQRFCFTEVGLFKRDSNLGPGRSGTRTAGSNEPDPLLGLDMFEGSNLSNKNPNFRTGRCGECHALPTLTDNTMPFTFKAQLRDFVGEFISPGVENTIEPLGRLRLISGFLLESEINEAGQDGVERRMINQSIQVNPSDGLAYPDGYLNPDGNAGTVGTVAGDNRFTGAGQAFFDNGVYNLGVRPIAEDIGRGGNDAFGWPLSLAALLMKNLGGPGYEPAEDQDSSPMSTFTCASNPCDQVTDGTGGLFEETLQDQLINPGFEGEPANPLLPPYLAPFANQINVGDGQPELDEVFAGINTATDTPMLEGFLDTLGPFNPAGTLPEALNSGDGAYMGTWPGVNRVGRKGSFKAAQLREVELTGPYFHNGGKLTLRQVVDFYSRGGDFPMTNAAHRDFNMVNQNMEVQSNLSELEKVALVDFLLQLTDDRVAFERAPFDHPEVIIPLDGEAPENTGGRTALVAGCTTSDPAVALSPGSQVCASGAFLDIPASGAGGITTRLPAFLGLTNDRLVGDAAACTSGITSQYCH
jgi:cytochrome c peroxidase